MVHIASYDAVAYAKWSGNRLPRDHEWDFADGSRSVHQEDCEPFTAETRLDRHFTRRHAFDAPGEYQVVVTLRQSNRVVGQAATTILIQGAGPARSSPYSASLH